MSAPITNLCRTARLRGPNFGLFGLFRLCSLLSARLAVARMAAGFFALVFCAMATAQTAPAFSREQIDQMMAPIALYPDSLLSQVLMAATYPADVADAAKWSKAHPDQKGDAAVKAVQTQSWDPSVQSLVAFPQVIQTMGDQPDWVQNLGDAFLASSKDVLDSTQRLRQQAQRSGNLKSNEQQKVIVEQEPQTQQTVIKIEPAQPQTVYVPAYNPTVVYGAWPYPAYPPYYYPPPVGWYPGAALATGIAFGVGVAAVGALWGNCNWGGGNVNVNVNRYNSINTNRQISANQSNWQHNAANRRDVPYRDQASRQKYERGNAGAEQRADFRGHDGARDSQRQQAQSALQQRGMDPGAGRESLRNDPATRDRAQRAAEGTARDRAGAGTADRGGLGGGDRAGGAGGLGGGDRAGAAGGLGGGDRGGIDRGQTSQISNRASDNALRGAGGGMDTQRQMDRGAASRQSFGGSQAGAGSARMSGGGGGGGARMSGGGGGGARMGGGGGRGGGRR
ncbi:DUF3300 domain-containing protein [Variovorax dokdonensis]|uniref:DUF3300 domain-containing protein n=1 Tax=Variovorax dokdonensis TaxID=344883 RepID=A0ABT7NGM7_9BURK|nr:DUF3300 domain-containing protein [Variovorax dokdonensis]MDM0047088.1 DUF3300 domain-containing protein [Variovorax dokdonensis]